MLDTIIYWAIRHRWMTISVAALIAVIGLWSLATMNIDVLPNVNKPTVAIFTEAEGLAPEEVERLVLTPVESAVSGAPGVTRVTGTASFGLAIVNAEFQWGSDIYRNRQIIQERLAQAVLPDGIVPKLGPVSSIMGEIVWAGLTSDNPQVNAMQLRTIADWTIRPALLRIPGISDVLVMGGDVREWQILLNAERMRRAGIMVSDVVDIVGRVLKNRGGGILVQGGKEYPIRIMSTPSDVADLRLLTLGKSGDTIVRLGDIATVEERAKTVRGTASIDGKEGVILRIIRQPDAQTLTVTKAIDETLANLNNSLPSGVTIHNDILRQEEFIHNGLTNVLEALRDGGIFVIIILIVFLMNVRTTAITLMAIPMSILATAIVFRVLGFSVNVMTMGGIAVAIGELVDDAIVDVENVYRRLRGWMHQGRTESIEDIVFHASSEVRNSIVYATIVVAVVFLPIFFIPGVEGRLLQPLGLAYLVSLIASLIVSLTVTPALCVILFGSVKTFHQEKDTRFVTWLKERVTPGILWSIDHPKHVMATAALTVVVAIGLFVGAGKQGIPTFNEGAVTIMMWLPVGTDLKTTNDFASRIEERIRQLPEVRRVAHSTGRAGADAHASGANSSEFQINFKPGMEQERTRLFAEIQTILDTFPGADYMLGQPITHRMQELVSGARGAIVVKVYGDDLVALRQTADIVKSALAAQSGVKNVQIQKEQMIPELRIYPSATRLSDQGLSSGDVAEELEHGLMGATIGQVRFGTSTVDVVARFDPMSRDNVEALRDLALPFTSAPSLASAADIRVEGGRNSISHEGGKRVLIVNANYQGHDSVGAVDHARAAIFREKLPQGVMLSFEGDYKSQKENSRLLAILFGVGLMLIFGVLYHHFRAVPLVLQVMMDIPTAFIGGVIGIWLTGGEANLAHLIGFVSLSGIVSRNGIMLISNCFHLVREQGLPFTPETIVKATLDRLVPVSMTALTAMLSLIPLIAAADAPGKEMLHPLAVVIFGGLMSSTVISLFLTPAVFYRFGRSSVISVSHASMTVASHHYS